MRDAILNQEGHRRRVVGSIGPREMFQIVSVLGSDRESVDCSPPSVPREEVMCISCTLEYMMQFEKIGGDERDGRFTTVDVFGDGLEDGGRLHY